jgi:hypothetical protein
MAPQALPALELLLRQYVRVCSDLVEVASPQVGARRARCSGVCSGAAPARARRARPACRAPTALACPGTAHGGTSTTEIHSSNRQGLQRCGRTRAVGQQTWQAGVLSCSATTQAPGQCVPAGMRLSPHRRRSRNLDLLLISCPQDNFASRLSLDWRYDRARQVGGQGAATAAGADSIGLAASSPGVRHRPSARCMLYTMSRWSQLPVRLNRAHTHCGHCTLLRLLQGLRLLVQHQAGQVAQALMAWRQGANDEIKKAYGSSAAAATGGGAGGGLLNLQGVCKRVRRPYYALRQGFKQQKQLVDGCRAVFTDPGGDPDLYRICCPRRQRPR